MGIMCHTCHACQHGLYANVPNTCELLIFTCQCANKHANIPVCLRCANYWTWRVKDVPVFQLGVWTKLCAKQVIKVNCIFHGHIYTFTKCMGIMCHTCHACQHGLYANVPNVCELLTFICQRANKHANISVFLRCANYSTWHAKDVPVFQLGMWTKLCAKWF